MDCVAVQEADFARFGSISTRVLGGSVSALDRHTMCFLLFLVLLPARVFDWMVLIQLNFISTLNRGPRVVA